MVGFDRALLLATVYRSVYGVAASYITARLAARSAHAARLGVWLRGPCREHHGRRRDVKQGTGLRAPLVSASADRACDADRLGWRQTPRDAA